MRAIFLIENVDLVFKIVKGDSLMTVGRVCAERKRPRGMGGANNQPLIVTDVKSDERSTLMWMF